MSIKLTDPVLQFEDVDTINKYKKAGSIAAQALESIISQIKPGVKLHDLCIHGDTYIDNAVKKIYKDIKIKGISFPTCVSKNNIAGHYSPQSNDNEFVENGDLIKVELGVHIDGYPALIAYTVVVIDSNKEIVIDDRRANVVRAVIEASRKIFEIMTPKYSNLDVVKILEDTSKKYDCSLPTISRNVNAPGVISYQISRGIVDGYNDDKYDDNVNEYVHGLILCKHSDTYDFKQRETQFEEDEVYAIDVMMCSGKGKLNISDFKTMIYKRLPDKRISLQRKSSRETLSSFKKNRFPVNIREKANGRFKLGLKECTDKGLVEAYPVFEEKQGEYVARVKFTVIVRDKPILITGKSANSELKKLGLFL